MARILRVARFLHIVVQMMYYGWLFMAQKPVRAAHIHCDLHTHNVLAGCVGRVSQYWNPAGWAIVAPLIAASF